MTKIDQPQGTAHFHKALLEISSKLNRGTYALAGGLAVGYWIRGRKTQDLDFVLVSQDMGYLKELFPHQISEGVGIYSVKVCGVSVDFLKPATYPWNQEAIHHARELPVEGVVLPVITPEYLVLYKMQVERVKDQADVIALLKLPRIHKKARKLVERYLSQQHVEDLDQWKKHP